MIPIYDRIYNAIKRLEFKYEKKFGILPTKKEYEKFSPELAFPDNYVSFLEAKLYGGEDE